MGDGFDSEIYRSLQLDEIKTRAKGFKRLYLEVGGKLLYDGHASRVLPGYCPENKLKIIQEIKNLGLVYCVNANDLVSKKRLTKKKLNYFKYIKQELEQFERREIFVEAVVITMFEGQKKIKKLQKYLKKKKIRCFVFNKKDNYLEATKYALENFEENGHIPVKKRIIVLTGPAGGSGKMSVAMSQLYHEIKKDWNVNYAKVESFPVWNLPLNHPVNLAYEAATADLGDHNEIDELHLKAYKIKATNYNRDLDNFKILRRITGKRNPFGYRSTTDMGINNIKLAIKNEKIVEAAAIKEIISRYERYKEEVKKGREDKKTILRMQEIARKAE